MTQSVNEALNKDKNDDSNKQVDKIESTELNLFYSLIDFPSTCNWITSNALVLEISILQAGEARESERERVCEQEKKSTAYALWKRYSFHLAVLFTWNCRVIVGGSCEEIFVSVCVSVDSV